MRESFEYSPSEEGGFYKVPKKDKSLQETDRQSVEDIYRELMERTLPRRMGQYQKMIEQAGKEEMAAYQTSFLTELDQREDEMWDIAVEQYRAQKQLETDDKTPLLKEPALANRYEKALNNLAEFGEKEEVMVFIHFDLDRFRVINETITHGGADGVLREIGVKILGMLRAYDAASRTGGDEFEIILNHIKKNDVCGVVERILKELSQVVWNKNTGEKIGLSAGIHVIAKGEKPYFTKEQGISDTACYITKNHGRNGYTLLEGNEYICYELKKGKYNEREGGSGRIDEFRITPNDCKKEIESSLQRSLETIKLYLSGKNLSFESEIKRRYGVTDYSELTLKMLSELLFEAKESAE